MGKSVLIVSTSHEPLGDVADKKTGLWAEELMGPYYVLTEAGFDVTVASVKGGKIPIDAGSLGDNFKTDAVKKFMGDAAKMKLIEESVALSAATADYDAIFLPGGHGTCWDFVGNAPLAGLVSKMFGAGKVVGAVCHGPMGLVDVKVDGKSIVSGKKVTGFTNTEEEAVGLTKVVPFLLEDKLKELGGLYEKSGDWSDFAVRDGNLITGQNPQSSVAAAKLMVEALA
mmetsp:Transcript_69534/g.220133  ORF Transcript_69534/g.220133 Transcript_69534/m.220133 type:complete len:227 (+) Transcript_69534:461-1141(+)